MRGPLLGALLGGWAAALGACAVAPTTPPPLERASLEETAGGGGVATLPYPSGGLVHVALFVDAGSRDGASPMTATLAAKLAAAAAGVQASVGPDLIELSVEAEAEALPEAIARLGEALGARRVDAEAFGAMVQQLEGQRARALGHTERVAVGLSLEALLGAQVAQSLDPLGGGPAPERAAVEAFLADHFGAERALLVVAGEVAGDEARRLYREARARWPQARTARAARPVLEAQTGAVARVGRRASVAVSAALPSLEAARAAQAMLGAELDEERGASFAYGLRGGGLLTVSLDGPRERGALRKLALAVLRAADLAAQAPGQGDAWPRGPHEAARQLGLRWATRGAPGPEEPRVALGVSVPGGRADGPAEAPDAAALEAAEGALRESLAAVEAAARPALRAEEAPPGAYALDNGARLRVIETGADTPFGLVIAFEGAVAEELPSARGRAALLTEALATQCGRALGPEARIEPFVEAAAVGLSLTAPAEGWARLAALTLRCALEARLDARAIEDARVQLLSRIARTPEAELMAAAARALAPSAPSAVWGLGRPRSVADLSADALPAALAQLRVGARVRVAAMGPLPPEATRRFLGASLSSLPEGSAPRAPRLGTALTGPIPLEGHGRAFVALGLRLGPRSPAAARAYADALAEGLREEGHRVPFSTGGGGAGGAWALVRVDSAPQAIPALAARLRALRPSAERLERHLAQRERAQRWAAASPGPLAALAMTHVDTPEGDADEALEPSATLLFVGRAQPEEALERLEGEAAR